MRIAGQWVGWGLGDRDPKVQDIKRHVLRKFGWARGWSPTFTAESPEFDATLEAVTVEMQRRYGLPMTGVWDWRTQVTSGFYVPAKPKPVRPLLFTVCGTGVPWWVGPDADTGRAVEDRYRWQPIGYPARPFPMGQSVDDGCAEFVVQAERWRPDIERAGAAMVGYSQGAIVCTRVWEREIQSGRLSWMRPHVKAAVMFGNPMREAGRAVGDANGVAPDNDSHGIADELQTDTPGWWLSVAHKGDIYTDCSGQRGEWMTAIYKIVMGAKVFDGPDSLLAQAVETIEAPAVEVVAAFRAVLSAGLFFGARTAPHVNYSPAVAIEHLRKA